MTKPAGRGRASAFYGCLGMLLLATGCTQTPLPDTRAADEAAIREADAQWSKAAETRDLDAMMSFYADDAQLLAERNPMVANKKAIRALWAPLLVPEHVISWKATKVEVARSGEIAYVVGAYVITMKPANEVGKLVEVWKKQADGKWKCAVDMFNGDVPDAVIEKK